MEFRLSSARLYAGCGLLVLLAMLAPQTGVASPPLGFTTLATPCVAGPTTLCLNEQRFKIEVQWKDFQGNTGVGQAVPLTSDTGYFWFFSSNNVELVVKVLDGRGLNAHFWVFFGALSNVEYTMSVTDSVTGSVKTYFNPSGQFASVGDTQAFSASGSVISAHRYVEAHGRSMSASPITLHSTAENSGVAGTLTTCVGTETSLCLNGGRFRVEVNWKDFQGNTGVGKAISLTADTGYFWFFNSTNVELVVKVLDARTLNNRFWVFYGALSNVEYEMTVTDTLTGNINTYSNPAGRFASTGDTGAFRAGYGVTARLDPSRAVSSDIPTSGGTITATAGDGTVFTLTIPRDALLSEAKITMTPATALDGLPLSGGLAAAVDLAPTGLRLFQFATLAIAPAAAIPLAEEITFGWRGNGEEFFLYPPALGTAAISMKLLHFSGYGVGRGSAADQMAQRQRVPPNAEDAFSQRLQELFAIKRRTQSLGVRTLAEDEDIEARIEAALRAEYESALASVRATKADCPRAKANIYRGLHWARHAQLAMVNFVVPPGTFDSEIQTINEEMIEALVHCYDKSFQKCVQQNDPTQMYWMLAFRRQLGLLGSENRADEAKIDKCGRFELDFESVIEDALKFRHQVRAMLPLTYASRMIGATELVYSIAYIGTSLSPCTSSVVGTNSGFRVLKMEFDENVFEGNTPPRHPLKFMEYVPGDPKLTFTVTCPSNPPFTQIDGQGLWRLYYRNLHLQELSGDSIKAEDWTFIGGRVWARKSYQTSDAISAETTIITLKHTPE